MTPAPPDMTPPRTRSRPTPPPPTGPAAIQQRLAHLTSAKAGIPPARPLRPPVASPVTAPLTDPVTATLLAPLMTGVARRLAGRRPDDAVGVVAAGAVVGVVAARGRAARRPVRVAASRLRAPLQPVRSGRRPRSRTPPAAARRPCRRTMKLGTAAWRAQGSPAVRVRPRARPLGAVRDAAAVAPEVGAPELPGVVRRPPSRGRTTTVRSRTPSPRVEPGWRPNGGHVVPVAAAATAATADGPTNAPGEYPRRSGGPSSRVRRARCWSPRVRTAPRSRYWRTARSSSTTSPARRT